ncbi:hypothetical protein CSC03_3335 [Enterobacter hormaechei]|nr:hypothetical protein CSC03_3335 [Enterobacter hormaechei]
MCAVCFLWSTILKRRSIIFFEPARIPAYFCHLNFIFPVN